MEKNKELFEACFHSTEDLVALSAMENQWFCILCDKKPFFTPRELWKINASLAAKGLGRLLVQRQNLIFKTVFLLRNLQNEGLKIPVEIFIELASLATYNTNDEEDKFYIRYLLEDQNFVGTDLYSVIAALFSFVDRMPEWREVGDKFIQQISPDVNFCIQLQRFLQDWGRLDRYSDEMVAKACEKIIPEWAGLIIEALNNVPGPYRYDLSLNLFKKYFDAQPYEVTRAILHCFEEDSDVELQQKLLDELFDFFLKQKDDLDLFKIFIEEIKHFLLRYWPKNCFKFAKLWEKYQNPRCIFDIVCSAFTPRYRIGAFANASEDELARLKSPLHMLCYLPVADSAELSVLLLHVIVHGTAENTELAYRILNGQKDFLCCSDNVEKYLDEIEKLFSSSQMAQEYLVSAERVVNALIKNGPKVKDVERLEAFIKQRSLNVPAFVEVYEEEIAALDQKRREKQELFELLKY